MLSVRLRHIECETTPYRVWDLAISSVRQRHRRHVELLKITASSAASVLVIVSDTTSSGLKLRSSVASPLLRVFPCTQPSGILLLYACCLGSTSRNLPPFSLYTSTRTTLPPFISEKTKKRCLFLLPYTRQLNVSRRDAERRRAQRKVKNQKGKKDMTRNGQKISFTQLVKTTTTPIKRRNLLKLCLSAPLRDI